MPRPCWWVGAEAERERRARPGSEQALRETSASASPYGQAQALTGKPRGKPWRMALPLWCGHEKALACEARAWAWFAMGFTSKSHAVCATEGG